MSEIYSATDHAIIEDATRELLAAEAKFAPFNSAHEGWAVIKEELDELWEHVRGNSGYSEAAYREACQVAAMALRYMKMIDARGVEKALPPMSQAGSYSFRLFGIWRVTTLNFCRDRREARKQLRWFLRPFVTSRREK